MKKIISLVLLCVAVSIFGNSKILAETQQTGLDAVLAIDTSKSMSNTDPDRIAPLAAELFIDMMNINDTSRVGLVPFSDVLGECTKLSPISTIGQKNNLKEEIESFEYKGFTDIGLALKKSFELINDTSNNSKKIIFFTDGRIDLGSGRVRTEADSLADVKDVVKKAKESGVVIYTVGLNVNGSVDEQLLADIANNTNGKKYSINSADALPEIFDEIFADSIGGKAEVISKFVTDGVNENIIEIPIEDNSALEANIVLLTSRKLTEIGLYDPDGNLVESSQKVLFETTTKYSLYKVISPRKGVWKLKVNGDEGIQVQVNLILNYKVELVCDAQIGDNGKGVKTISITSWLENEGKKVEDDFLLSSFTCEAYVADSVELKKQQLNRNGSSFEIIISADNVQNNVDVYTHAENDTLFRESNVISLDLNSYLIPKENRAPEFVDLPDEIELSGLVVNLQKEKLNFEDFIHEPDGDDYTIKVFSDNDDIVEAETDDEKVIIKANHKGDAKVKIKVTDSKGKSSEKTIKVHCGGIIPNLFIILGVLAGLIAIIVIILVVKKASATKHKPHFGSIRWNIVRDGSFIESNTYNLQYDVGVFSIGSVISNPIVGGLGLNKVELIPKDMENEIIVNKSSSCSMLDDSATKVSKLVLSAGQHITLQDSVADPSISVKITYVS